MKKFKKLCCIFLAVALLCVGLTGCGGQDDKDKEITNLSIGGAGTSGTFYILGAAYADLLTKQLGINTVCEVTAGSVENVTLMADGQIVETGTPDECFDNPKTERARDFLNSIKGH